MLFVTYIFYKHLITSWRDQTGVGIFNLSECFSSLRLEINSSAMNYMYLNNTITFLLDCNRIVYTMLHIMILICTNYTMQFATLPSRQITNTWRCNTLFTRQQLKWTFHHMRKTPKLVFGIGALRAALILRPRTCLVCFGSITPSSHIL